MNNYKVIGIDLAKTKFHLAAINDNQVVVLKKAIKRKEFFEQLPILFIEPQTFAFEACGGSHYTAQKLQEFGRKSIRWNRFKRSTVAGQLLLEDPVAERVVVHPLKKIPGAGRPGWFDFDQHG